MSLIDDPKRNWVIPPFFLAIGLASGLFYDYIRWNYHDYFWIIGFATLISGVFAIIFSIANSIVMLRNYVGEKEHFKWWKVLSNLLPILLIAYYVLSAMLY